MIRKLILSLSILIVAFSIYADEELTFTATVPDDYGVVVPDGVLMFDRFAINIKGIGEHDFLLSQDLLYLGDILEAEENEMNFSMLYYGNLGRPYDVKIEIDPGHGWYFWQGETQYRIPISISYSSPIDLDEDIYLWDVEEDAVRVSILPSGPKTASPVVDVKMAWEGTRDLVPGVYQTDLKVKVDVV